MKRELIEEKKRKSISNRHLVTSSTSEARLNESIRMAMAKAGKDGASMQKLIEELKVRLLRMEKQLVELREENLALKELNGMGDDEIGLKRDYQDIKFRYQQLLIENEQLKSQPDWKSNYNKLLSEYNYILFYSNIEFVKKIIN